MRTGWNANNYNAGTKSVEPFVHDHLYYVLLSSFFRE